MLCSVSYKAKELPGPCSGCPPLLSSASGCICKSGSACTKEVSVSRNQSPGRWNGVGALVVGLRVSAEGRAERCPSQHPGLPPPLLCVGPILTRDSIFFCDCKIFGCSQVTSIWDAGFIQNAWPWNKQHFVRYNKGETLLCSLGVLANISAGAFNVPLWTRKIKRFFFSLALAVREQTVLTWLGVQICENYNENSA